jgi:hypothetical protein
VAFMTSGRARTRARRTRALWAWLALAGIGAGCGGRAANPPGDGGTDRVRDKDSGGSCTPPTKVDVLFDIDNSASMGDLQSYLAAAVPDLVTRLVQPNCVMTDGTTGVRTIVGLSNNGNCASGTIEFPPVSDLHVGIISTSLGTRGVTGAGAVCKPGSMTNPFNDPGMHPAISAHDDDRGELLNRTAMDAYTEGTSADTGGQSFLDWFPRGPGWAVNDGKTATSGPQASSPSATAIDSAPQIESDFQSLVVGVHAYGCGIVSPLESWYRFLVQPDPYDSIAVVGGVAKWNGVDATIIRQRHDFLRPDSLVLIVDVSDKNDQEIDVRSLGGQAYKFMDENFQPPRATSSCAANPGSAQCTSCAYMGDVADPNCKLGPYTAADDPGFYIGVRTVNMQQKYGLDAQFPIGRYVLGLTSPKVPDRDHEYPAGASSYQGGLVYSGSTLKDGYNLDCTNPLFAATLPDGSDLSPGALCNTEGAGGPRTLDRVLFAHIGGVPHQLLQQNPSDPNSPAKDALSPSDWVKILGQGWESAPSPAWAPNLNEYDATGIDPHMIQALEPRPGLIVLETGPKPTGGGPDPISGGEWVTNGTSPEHKLPVDLEYACIFPLATPLDCTSQDYSVQEACSCSGAGLPLNAIPPVCGTQSGGPYVQLSNDYTKQYYAKAYPTVRELEVARLMGPRGIVGSLCPIHVTPVGGEGDPLYGFRPAFTAVVNRLTCDTK